MNPPFQLQGIAFLNPDKLSTVPNLFLKLSALSSMATVAAATLAVAPCWWEEFSGLVGGSGVPEVLNPKP